MTRDITLTLLQGWLIAFLPVGLLGLGMWALWRLIPRLRRSMGYGTSPCGRSRLAKHPFSK